MAAPQLTAADLQRLGTLPPNFNLQMLNELLQRRWAGEDVSGWNPQAQGMIQWYDTSAKNATVGEPFAPASPAKTQAQEGIFGELGQEEGAFADAPRIARNSAIEDSKLAGNFSQSPQFMAGLEAEASARTKGIQTASKGRQNELRKQLGLPPLE